MHAVDGVSFEIPRGGTLGLVGESGSGKSTVARLVTRLLEPTAGEIVYDGTADHARESPRPAPTPARDPARLPGSVLLAQSAPHRRCDRGGAAARCRGSGRAPSVARECASCSRWSGSTPSTTTGTRTSSPAASGSGSGSRAHSITTPKLVVADEPVSALDVSIQAQILNLLAELQDEFGLTYLFIAHDLNVVRHVSDRIAVMYLGKIVELSPADELHARPVHPYTEALLSAVPHGRDDARERLRSRVVLRGDPPSPVAPPPGCRFHTRCRYATEICSAVEPPLVDHRGGHLAACHHPLGATPPAAVGARAA